MTTDEDNQSLKATFITMVWSFGIAVFLYKFIGGLGTVQPVWFYLGQPALAAMLPAVFWSKTARMTWLHYLLAILFLLSLWSEYVQDPVATLRLSSRTLADVCQLATMAVSLWTHHARRASALTAAACHRSDLARHKPPH